MATGIFMILDDIASLLDDTAVASKVAAKKTAGVLGDDLAVGAEKASGFSASRELPVLWAITKGSFRNKLIILPFAFLMSAYAPWLIVPILLAGGAYLSFEGAEKIFEYFLPEHIHTKPDVGAVLESGRSPETEEKKVKSAVLTDFILSIEIVIIALGTVVDQPLVIQVLVVTLIAVLATMGVYGFVALLVRMDDVGFYFVGRSEDANKMMGHIFGKLGRALIVSLPNIIRLLSVVGTIAMLMVGGGIFIHNIEAVHNIFGFLPGMLADIVSGSVAGFAVLAMQKAVKIAFLQLNNRQ